MPAWEAPDCQLGPASAKIFSMTSRLETASSGGNGTGESVRMAREKASAWTAYWSAGGIS